MILFDGSKRVYKGNLHVHTTCSDGHKSPEQVIELYKSHGYDFLAITDHRKVSYPTSYYGDFTVLSGMEVDFNEARMVYHILGIGISEEVGRSYVQGRGVQAAIDSIVEDGGVPILAHPSWSLNTPAAMMALRNVDICEIYNTVSGLPWNADRADASILVDESATLGKCFKLVATDDAHWYTGEHCRSYTMVQAENNSQEALIKALKEGNFYASQGPEIKLVSVEGRSVHVECSQAVCVMFSSDAVWSKDRSVHGENITKADYDLLPNEHFVRITVIDAEGRRAWFSPIEF